VIVIGSADPDDPLAKGSGRSIFGVNLGAAISGAASAGTIIAGGGHAMAAGLTLEFAKLKSVRADLSSRLRDEATAATGARDLAVDALIGIGGANSDLIAAMEQVGPYGAGWPDPVFGFANVRPFAAGLVGTGHVRVMLEDESGHKIRAICFRANATPLGDALMGKNPLHVIARVKKDEWRGGDAVDCEILDAASAS
jgi:single-stranded-DNA-specific exonuclease